VIAVGMVFLGFCQGYFGRDAHDEKRVEAFGADWIVARGGVAGDDIFLAKFDSTEERDEKVIEFAAENKALASEDPE